MGLLSMHIIGEVDSKEKAQRIAEKLRAHFPEENFEVTANYREELNTDTAE